MGKPICAVFVAAAFLMPSALHADNPFEGWTVNVMAENDLFGSDTDRHYTHGSRISVSPRAGEVPDWLKDAALMFPLFQQDGEMRASYALGQNIFTPADITLDDPTEFDRPYAGWTYGSMGLVSDRVDTVDTFEIALGLVGPPSLAEQAQKFVHKVIDSPQPQGWDHQLKTEPGLVLSYGRTIRRVWDWDTNLFDLELDATPYYGGSLGNVFTHLEGGAVFRLGHDLAKDRGGPPRIRPSLPGSDYYTHTDGFSWYIFGGLGGRLVARNIFLDGNSFTDSQSVDKNHVVGDFQMGVAVRYEDFRLAYTQVIRTKEFENQQLPDRFGAITLSYQF